MNSSSLRLSLLWTVAALSLAAGCTTVPIDPNDGTQPKVTIKVKGADGSFHELSNVDYGNNTASLPIEIMAVAEDPDGMKSIDLRFSDNTVDVANCGGGLYPGSWPVANLPPPEATTLSGSSGKVPTKLTATFKIEGILPLASGPPGETPPCYPANNGTITVRCVGKNWASNPASSTRMGFLQVRFTN